MTWAALSVLALACLTPLVFSLLHAVRAKGRRDAAIALYTAQLVELERDHEEKRLSALDLQSARLEIQRRLLQVMDTADPVSTPQGGGSQFAVVAALTLIPAGAVMLYLLGGSPGIPAAPHKEVAQALRERTAQEEALIGQLRIRLAQIDPGSEQARKGYVLLGNAEAARGDMAAAADAWRIALAARFDPMLAAEAAESLTEAAGHVTEDAANLFREALANAATDAAWRPLAEKRLGEVKVLPGAGPSPGPSRGLP